MPNITSVTSYFPTVFENTVPMSLGGTIAPGATTVPVNGMSNYSNGQTVVFTVDAGTPALKQVFTGQVSGSNVVNVVWTYGTNQTHTNGAPVIDYVSATTLDMVTTGILNQHTQAGAHINITSNTIDLTGAATLDILNEHTTNAGVTVEGVLIKDGALPAQNINIPYKFVVYRNAAWTTGNSANSVTVFDTKITDTGNNYNTSTGLFTAPVTGFYDFAA